jgi:hypothetical protein
MRSYLFGSTGMLAIVIVCAHCGGATEVLGGSGDASVDGSGGKDGASSSGSSSSGSSSSGSSSGSGSGSSSGGADCSPACNAFTKCCNATCINPDNDPQNCGGCGIQCTGDASYCSGGHCQAPPCNSPAPACETTQFCCATGCCNPGQLCCNVEGPVDYTTCFTPTKDQPTCPVGCGGCTSDRNLKHDLEPVDPESVLERVSRMPITTWSYKSDDPSVRHMGMMAQDFYGEFGLGSTDKAFNPIDAHGVEMAAIQALYQHMQEQETRIRKLEEDNRELRRSRRREARSKGATP